MGPTYPLHWSVNPCSVQRCMGGWRRPYPYLLPLPYVRDCLWTPLAPYPLFLMLFHKICNFSGPNTMVICIHNTDQHVYVSKHEALRVVYENCVCNAIRYPQKKTLRG